MDIVLTEDQFILVTLLVKIGVMACLASVLVRSQSFKRILLSKQKGLREKWQFATLFGSLLSIGVIIRLLLNYNAADLSLSGTLLVGLLMGPMAGVATGCMVGLPAVLSGEFLALPMGVLYGLVGGGINKACPTKEEIWDFSPFPDLNFYRLFKTGIRIRRLDWKIILFTVCLSLEVLRIFASRKFGAEALFSLSPQSTLVLLCVLASTVFCLGIPLKIWNNTRIEILLKEQETLVMQARFAALKSQINPHFLFNTLNSISSSIRSDPERARLIILKLSSILRKLLRADENFVPLREELEFIDTYLDVEVVRFGWDKLRIEKRIDPESLDVMIPTMVLQPIVENAIKHGIAPKVDGGTIRISTSKDDKKTIIEIEDDGEGIPEDKIDHILDQGIGISNVNERLKVAFGPEYQLQLRSHHGEGTCVRMEIPDFGILRG